MSHRRSHDVMVVGGARADHLLVGARLPGVNETRSGELYRRCLGGMGAMQALGAARLGAHVGLVARVGSDRPGVWLTERLLAERVDVRHVVRDAEGATGAGVLLLDGHGNRQGLLSSGANRHLSLVDVRGAALALHRTRVVSAQLDVPLAAVRLAFELGRAAGAKLVLDPAEAQALPEDLLRVDLLRVSVQAARRLTGVEVRDAQGARRAAAALLARGPRAVAVSTDEPGELLGWAGGELWLPWPPMRRVDPTGAGEAFVAVLAVALARGRPLAEAGPRAAAAAAFCASRLGHAGLPRPEQLQRTLGRVRGAGVHRGA